jgi:hypothetical protein
LDLLLLSSIDDLNPKTISGFGPSPTAAALQLDDNRQITVLELFILIKHPSRFTFLAKNSLFNQEIE